MPIVALQYLASENLGGIDPKYAFRYDLAFHGAGLGQAKGGTDHAQMVGIIAAQFGGIPSRWMRNQNRGEVRLSHLATWQFDGVDLQYILPDIDEIQCRGHPRCMFTGCSNR